MGGDSAVFLIDDLLTLPIKGAIWAIEQIYERAMEEYNDEPTIRKRLVTLRLAYEMGEIDDETYAEAEAELTTRLREIRMARLAELRGDAGGAAGTR